MTSDQAHFREHEVGQIAEGLMFLYRNLSTVMLWNMLLPLIIWFTFRDVMSLQSMLPWMVSFYLVTIVRIVISLYFSSKPSPLSSPEISRWGWWITVPSTLAGCVWGYAVYVFFEGGSVSQQLILLTIINGVCVLSLVISAYWLPAFYGFVIPALSGEAIYFATQAESGLWIIAAVALLLLTVLLKIGNSTNELTSKALKLKFENLHLIKHLTAEKERAENASRSKSRFLAAASHDLRQPVHSLTMFTDALRMEVKEKEAIELVEHMNQSVEDLDTLLTALLDISKLDAGVVTARKMPINILTLINNLVSEFQALANQKELYLRVRVFECHVYTDPLLLSTVIRNLLQNAIRFTESGGILIGLRSRGDNVLLQVWDSGIGIPDDKIDHIFVEFFQIDNVERDRQKGLGLGLSISRRLSDLLDHQLRVKTWPGKGTVFEVEMLKVARGKVIPVHAEFNANGQSLRGKRLLVIDNEISILQGMLSVLSRWHCQVDTASTAQDALGLVRQGNHYDSYISDYHLGPGMNGVELLTEFSKIDGGRTPGIILTGNTEAEFIRSVSDSRFVLLHKPVKPAQLRASLLQQTRMQDVTDKYVH